MSPAPIGRAADGAANALGARLAAGGAVRDRGVDSPLPAEYGSAHLEVDGLVTGYSGAPPVLHDICVMVRRGEIVAVLGRNGAGKTTLLRAISGLLPWREGDVRVDGKSLRDHESQDVAARGVAHVPEGRRIIPTMSVLDNLRLGGYLLRRRAPLEERLNEVLTMFPALAEWKRRVAGTLSGGEQQMLSIARALMGHPTAVMLDEPLTGLAPIFRKQVLQTLSAISRTGTAVLLVEQNVAESFQVADRALILHEGVVALEGTPEELARDDAVRASFLDISSS